MNQVRLGLPKGSLNKKGRGETNQVFLDAGYDITGYEPGNEDASRLDILNDPQIKVFLSRPQSAPVELMEELLDIAIIGEDWVKEESSNGNSGIIRKIGDLNYGETKLVVAIPQASEMETLGDFFIRAKKDDKPVKCWTEYVNLTRRFFGRDDDYGELFGDSTPIIRIRSLYNGNNDLVRILNSDGVTEGYIEKGADIIVDNSASGKTLQEYGLKPLEVIMKSCAGLYAGPSCTGIKEKKAQEIFKLLKGAIDAKNYFDVKFNVSNERIDKVKDYIVGEGLCSDEPTITKGENFSAVNILIPRNVFPQVLNTLKQNYDASSIMRNETKQFVK